MTRIPKSVRSTGQILKGSNHILHSLFTQSRELINIEKVVHRNLDDPVAVSSLKNNELTIVTRSGAVATRLRYRQRNLMNALRRAGISVNAIKFKVQPELLPPEPPTVDRHLSRENAHQLAESAQYIEDEPLKKALMHLSKNSE
ncbi:MAG: DUF721 domain-containing protein [Gammaproteobacteria bacterium]|jgi:hypothetical protein|nr:DUF721 domain-containing protein [Gammaproteobacteria bacterium]MBT4493471.1 DUF721 domain-containing protein [Gammaproteobacteria bacterium]MBT7370346.1 DUF721 domain-containing protein [Gammaproteobacteria bacterium]